eukprot:TRINITY_DN5669_c0_g2_i1.p1 TRINITY_DN5669_c0_g2~~TRINITY_DN5669_c0_g2_i1.p1  ORF type:complete len:578 (+),score=143.59 TRINITY_DN5669_c0_g2_i1:53-1786(+)
MKQVAYSLVTFATMAAGVTMDPCDGMCASPNVCTTAGCDPMTGNCEYTPLADGTSCDDNDAFTINDRCQGGFCMGDPDLCVMAPACPDTECSTSKCDPATGNCVNTPKADGTMCNDNDIFTTNDRCLGGNCIGDPDLCVMAPACPDTECSTSKCDPATGNCVNTPKADGTMCNDNDIFTINDRCLGGNCIGDPDLCAMAPACPNTECSTGKCDPANGNCVFTPVADGTGCDDMRPETNNDRCKGGVCMGDLDLCDMAPMCPDTDCTVGSCDPATGNCIHTPVANGIMCDDMRPDTDNDRCRNGVCMGDLNLCAMTTCPDTDCTTGRCDPSNGNCIDTPVADGIMCDDMRPETMFDKCVMGTCVGEMDVCAGLACVAPDNNCLTSSCSQAAGRCVTSFNPSVCDCAPTLIHMNGDDYLPKTTTVTSPFMTLGGLELRDIPTALSGAYLSVFEQSIQKGSELTLSCCDTECTFVVSVYHCPPCSSGMNGGFPSSLPLNGFEPASCGPFFWNEDKAHHMVSFTKTLVSGQTTKVVLTEDAPFMAVFEHNKGLQDSWCFKSKGPFSGFGPGCAPCPVPSMK